MDDIPNCPKCDSSNLLINIWGMPAFDEVEKLQASGYQVEMHGCMPPLIIPGEDAFIYHCKDCGEKFLSYDETIDDEDYDDEDEDY